MEWYGWVIAIVIVLAIIGYIMEQTEKSSQNTKSSSKQSNFSSSSFRVIDKPITLNDGTVLDAFHFQMKGLIPPYPRDTCSNCSTKRFAENDRFCNSCGSALGLTITISLFDEQERAPLISLIDVFQEQDTRFFLSARELGNVPEGSGFPSWTTLGYAIKEALLPPRSSQTKVSAIYRFLRTGYEAHIYQGALLGNQSDIFSTVVHPSNQTSAKYQRPDCPYHIELDSHDTGYLDMGENSKTAQKQTLRLAVDLALIDGEMHESEGNIIKNWMRKYVDDFEGEEKEHIKNDMNETMKDAYAKSQEGTVNRKTLVKELKRVGQKADFYETMELLMDIMAADDIADKDELSFIDEVGSALEILPKEIQSMKDIRLLNNKELNISSSNADQILGIDPTSMSREEICKKLATDFMTWNDRLTSLTDEDERESAQNMLNNIQESQSVHCA